jgi:hypothetical protein
MTAQNSMGGSIRLGKEPFKALLRRPLGDLVIRANTAGEVEGQIEACMLEAKLLALGLLYPCQ